MAANWLLSEADLAPAVGIAPKLTEKNLVNNRR
jgi:hypothetical protein